MIKPPLGEVMFSKVLQSICTEKLYSFRSNDNKNKIEVRDKDSQIVVGCITFFKGNKMWGFEPDMFAGDSERSVIHDMIGILNVLNNSSKEVINKIEDKSKIMEAC